MASTGLSRPALSTPVWVALLAIVGAVGHAAPALASQPGHHNSHCQYRHTTTHYRYLPSDSGNEMRVDNVTLNWMIVGRTQTYGGAPGAIFWFGATGDIPLMGDWDGNGTDTVGVFRPSTGQWFFRNSNSNGPVDIGPFYFGNPGDKPVTGNWDTSDTAHEIGVVRGRTWYLRSSLSQGPTNVQFDFPASGSTSGLQPLLGDWDGDGDETPAYHG